MSRIYLRALEVEDHVKIHQWRNDPVYQKGVGSHVRYTNLETEKEWIKNVIARHTRGEEVRLAVVERKTDEIIGVFSLLDIDHFNKNASYHWMIGPSDKRGRGYALEAAAKVLHYGFSQLGLVRIWGHILDDNDNVFSFVNRFPKMIHKEGVLRKAVFKNGEYRDMIVVGILKEDFYVEIQKFAKFL